MRFFVYVACTAHIQKKNWHVTHAILEDLSYLGLRPEKVLSKYKPCHEERAGKPFPWGPSWVAREPFPKRPWLELLRLTSVQRQEPVIPKPLSLQ